MFRQRLAAGLLLTVSAKLVDFIARKREEKKMLLLQVAAQNCLPYDAAMAWRNIWIKTACSAALPMQQDDVCDDAASKCNADRQRLVERCSTTLCSDASASRRRCVSRRSLSRGDANLSETMREEKRITYYCTMHVDYSPSSLVMSLITRSIFRELI